MSGKEQGLRNS